MVNVRTRMAKAEQRLAVGDAGRPLAVYFRCADGKLRDRDGTVIDAAPAQGRVVIFTRRPADGESG